MKLDVSTILLVIVAVIPGLFAQRSRNQLVPRSFAPQGTTAELAELVALGIATHGILAFFTSAGLFLLGWFRSGYSDYFFQKLDSLILSPWLANHPVETSLIFSAYFFTSFFVSHWLGVIYGIWRSQTPLTARLLAHATWLEKWCGVTGLLGERPIIYEVLSPVLERGETKSVFIELEMKGGIGFYSGQLSQFSIVSDEEPHKPIYLIDVWYKRNRESEYVAVETDGIMIDLADAATLLVKQIDTAAPVNTPQSTDEEIALLAHKLWVSGGQLPGTAAQDWEDAKQILKQGQQANP